MNDLTLATMTYINADNVTKIYNNIPIQEIRDIWFKSIYKVINQFYKKDEKL